MPARRCANSLGHGALLLAMVWTLGPAAIHGQELGGAGTVQGTVKDPTGGVMQAVEVKISNPLSGFSRTATTDAAGTYIFRNLPPNPYHISVTAQGFQPLERDVTVRTSVPIDLELTLALAGTTATVDVVGHAEDLVERDPTAHTDVDQSLIEKLPLGSSGGLNQVITLASPGVVADANGFFHPIGDHAQTQFSIDNQPVTDQQSRIYSNQISEDAVQSMEIITGVPPAEFGDKNGLVVRIVTKSGLDAKPMGSFAVGYASFRTPSADVNLGAGTHTVGNFLSLNGLRTERFLDPPEFEALHDKGDSRSFFDRVDFRPSDLDTLHLNVQLARSSFDVPNTIDQNDAGQAQHQRITTINVAPGYTRVLGPSLLLAVNAFVRQNTVVYRPSLNPLSDRPGTVTQNRELRNLGAKVDVSYARGAHNVKFGGAFGATKLTENFSLGLTDPTANAPCVNSGGAPSDRTGLTRVTECGGAGLSVNPDFIPGLLAFDLARGGRLFEFNGNATVKGQSLYVQDEIKAGGAIIKLGLRGDRYGGLTKSSLVQPRLGLSYAVPRGGTILRASYGRTQETPYNESLVLASSADATVFGTGGRPLAPGKRDQGEVGIQQALGRWAVVDVGYFKKRTTNAYDFGVLFNTPIFFPVAWDHSKIDGLTARINFVEHGGFSAFTVMGHTDAIFSPPGTGGLLLEQPTGDFRIDHDQYFQQTTNLQYVFVKAAGAWAAFSWRFDSGVVAGSVPDYATALSFTGDQQAAIGVFCGGKMATPEAPITDCSNINRGATRLNIPPDGTADEVGNPSRIAPRHLFDLGLGVDNLLRGSRAKVRVRFSALNLANKVALYNFLSTFSGTHFVARRTYQVQVGVSF